MNRNNWFWGILFLCFGGLILMGQFGLFIGISPLRIVSTVLLVIIMLKNLRHRHFFGILFPIAILVIMYSSWLRVFHINAWSILVATFFVAMGLSILFRNKRHYIDGQSFRYHDQYHNVVHDLDGDTVYAEVKFYGETKYLHSTNLEKADFTCHFGSLKVYFDQAQVSPSGAVIHIDASFSSIELFFPRTWVVHENVALNLASIQHIPNEQEVSETHVTIEGNVSMGSIQIRYI